MSIQLYSCGHMLWLQLANYMGACSAKINMSEGKVSAELHYPASTYPLLVIIKHNVSLPRRDPIFILFTPMTAFL